MKGINRSMVCREISSLAKGVKRGGVCSGHDNGLMVIKFSCKVGRYSPGGNKVDEDRFIFPTKADAMNAAQTIFDMAKEHFIIQITICDYDAEYGDDGYISRTNSTGDVTYSLSREIETFGSDIGSHKMDLIKRNGNDQLIDSPNMTFISEEYAATVSNLSYSADAPYGSLIIVALP